MLIQKDRVVYDAAKLYVEYDQKGDIHIYSLVIQTVLGESVKMYVHDSKRIIDFIFDSVVAELNSNINKIVDMDYIISNAYE